MLDTGVHATLEDLARAKGMAPSYVSGILRLTLLAPEVVEAILDGRQPAELQLDNMLAGFPLEWGARFTAPTAASGASAGFRARCCRYQLQQQRQGKLCCNHPLGAAVRLP